MNCSRIAGYVALRARAQALADLQRRSWFVVLPEDEIPYATALADDVRPGAAVTKLIPGAPCPASIRV